MTDRVGVQMLHHYEPRLLFRLISGRRGESPWHPTDFTVPSPLARGCKPASPEARNLLSPASSARHESPRISFAMARACAANFNQVAVFSMGSPFYRATMRSPRRDRHASQ